jgi:hypothetical protein
VSFESESFDEFIERISDTYSDDFNDLDRQIEEDSSAQAVDRSIDSYHRAIVRASAMSAFLVVLSFVGIHWLSSHADKSIGKVSSIEVIALVGLLFFNLGIYSLGMFEIVNRLMYKLHYGVRRRIVHRRVRKQMVCKRTPRRQFNRKKCK